MALFSYRAMNADGRFVMGEMEAANLVDLELRLRRIELDFINGGPVKYKSAFRGGAIARRELINFCFHLEQLTRAGVPIVDALTDLRDSLEQARFRAIVASLIESIEGGQTLSQALSEHPKVFSVVFCSLVRAGEATGNLPEVLKNLNESLKHEDELASHTKKLLLYPSIVAIVVLSVTVFLLAYVVPELAKAIRGLGQTLPLQTRILIALSDGMKHYWHIALALPTLAVTALIFAVRNNPKARHRFDSLKLQLPVVGGILRKIILARFAAVFAMMYGSGIAIIDAIRATEDVVGNRVMREALQRVGQLITEGQNVTTAFQNVGLFPPLVVRMLRVGENTGALDTALANVSYFYNRDVRESIEKLQSIIEPTLTALLGGALLWVMLSVLGPVYDVITKLKV